MQNPPSPVDNDDARAAGVAAGLGCSIVVSIIICIVGGILLDEWLETSPWFTLLGVALGLIVAAYQLYELAMLGQKDREPKVVTRQITRFASKRSNSKSAADG
ncbi:MAG: AtpZ/AtpI family protein [Thermomicrobiales bacterium]|nr:AtpZ/AtpI family protein [Thermomicrobiales bacterium]